MDTQPNNEAPWSHPIDKIIVQIVKDWNDDNASTFSYQDKESMETLLQLLDSFLTTLEACKSQFQKTYQDNIKLVFLGNTGSGKTTSIHYLRGDELSCTLDDCEEATVTLADGLECDIGNDYFQSKTSACKAYESNNIKILPVFIDCPGFNDSRGLVYQIRNAYYMKTLSGLRNVKLVLVTAFANITLNKGTGFKELLSIMDKMFDIDRIRESLSLIITKGPQNKDGQIRKLREFYKENKTDLYAELLARDEMEAKTAVFPQLREDGIIPQRWRGDIEKTIKNCKATQLEFKFSVGDNAKLIIKKLSKLIRSYCVWLINNKLEEKNHHIKKQIIHNEYTHNQISLKAKLAQEFDGFDLDPGTASPEAFLASLKDFTNDQKACNLLQLARSSLLRLSNLINENEFKFDDWIRPLKDLKASYEKFAGPLVKTNQGDNSFRFEAPIITTSELKYEIMSGIKSLDLTSYLFIVDEDLDLPGINLNVCTYRWQAFENKKINLKGKDGTIHSRDGANGGNFYAFAQTVSNPNKVTVLTSGGCGMSGNYNIYFEKRKEENKQKIAQVQSRLNALKTLKAWYNNVANKKYSADSNGLRMIEAQSRAITALTELNNIKNHFDEELKKLKQEKSKSKSLEEKTRTFEQSVMNLRLNIDKLNESPQDFTSYEEIIDRAFLDFKKEIDTLSGKNEIALKKDELKRELNKKYRVDIHDQELFVSVADLQELDKTIEKLEVNLKEEKGKSEQIEKELEFICEKMTCLEQKVMENLNLENKRRERKENLREKCNLLQVLFHKLRNGSHGDSFIKIDLMVEIFNIQDELLNLDEKFEQLVVQKDNQIEGALEMFNQKIGGQLLTQNPDQDKFLKGCKAEKGKLEELLNNMKSSQKESLGKEKKDWMLKLLKDYKRLELQKKIIKIKKNWNMNTEAEPKEIDENLENLSQEINIFLEETGAKKTGIFESLKEMFTSDSKRSFDLLKALYELDCKSYLIETKIQELQTRINYANQYIRDLSNMNDQSKELKAKLDLKIGEYKTWKDSLKTNYPNEEQLHKLIEDYDKIIAPANYQKHDLFKLAEEILCKEMNLVTRVERKWSSRGLPQKLEYLAKELFCFNRQYYEKYELKGEKGGKGGDNGIIECNHPDISEVSEIGTGGQSSFSLEGVYLSEKSFVMVRNLFGTGINEVNEESKSGNVDGYIIKPMTSAVSTVMTNTLTNSFVNAVKTASTEGFKGIVSTTAPKAASVGLGWVIAGGLLFLQAAISPLVAIGGSKWVSGPLKVTEKNGQAGNTLQAQPRHEFDAEMYTLADYRRKISEFMKDIFPEEVGR